MGLPAARVGPAAAPPTSFIERDFPLLEITGDVVKEANSKKQIYQIHKWWARRLSSVFRTILIASSSPPRGSTHSIWARYSGGYSLAGKVVLDGMMGGGTSVIEALKLGATTVGVDINPVAWFITKKEVEPLNPSSMRSAFAKLESRVGQEINGYYETECPKGHTAEIMYTLWHKAVDCEKCGEKLAILPEHVVSEKEVHVKKKKRTEPPTTKIELVILCPYCQEIFKKYADQEDEDNDEIEFLCPHCSHRFKPRIGTSKKGRLTCPSCSHAEEMVHAVKRRDGRRLEFEMYCIEYYCKACDERGYKIPSKRDKFRFSAAAEELEKTRQILGYPREEIPSSKKEARPKNHGYTYFYQLFNERQLLCLSRLLKGIMEIEERNTREFMLLAFSASLETNNVFCKYETKWQKIGALFGLPGYHTVDRYAENNVWGTKYGRGTFTRSFLKLMRAKTLGGNGGAQETLYPDADTPKFTNLAGSFAELEYPKRGALLLCRDSGSLDFLSDESVDLVVTDPPYFDILDYSRLADFFYVWLRIGLKNDYPVFEPPSSARKNEVIVGGSPKAGERDAFVESLGRVFGEYLRVLKRSRPMVFTFHHTQRWAWRDLLRAIQAGGFSVVACHFVRSEGKTGFRKEGHISYDALIVCRKAEEATRRERPKLARTRTKAWVRRLSRAGNGLTDIDAQSVVMGNLLAYSPALLLDESKSDARIDLLWQEAIVLKNRFKVSREIRKSRRSKLQSGTRQTNLS